MKVLFLGSPNRGVGAWRQLMPARMLRSQGCDVRLIQSDDDVGPETYLSQVSATIEEFSPDILWSGRVDRTTIAIFKRYAHLRRIFDIDDMLLDVPNYNPAASVLRNKQVNAQRTLEGILRHTDLLSVSTAKLQREWSEKLTLPVHVCPNAIDTKLIPEVSEMAAATRRNDPKLRVGMVYTANRHGDIYILLPLLQKLIEEGLIRLTLMGSFPKEFWLMSPRDVRWVKFTPIEDYWVNFAASAPDVVISRLEPNDFNEAKSNIKWQEATLVGAVLAGSNWGELRGLPGAQLIEPSGDTSELEEWERTLRKLSLDKAEDGGLILSQHQADAALHLAANHTTLSAPSIEGWMGAVSHVASLDRSGQYVGYVRP